MHARKLNMTHDDVEEIISTLSDVAHGKLLIAMGMVMSEKNVSVDDILGDDALFSEAIDVAIAEGLDAEFASDMMSALYYIKEN